MKKLMFLIGLVALGALAMGCSSLLGHNASADSVPVTLGAATTNDANAVAWLKTAAAANAVANPTPTQEPIAAVMGGLIALVSSIATSYQHRQQTAQVAAIAANKPTPPAAG